MSKIEYSRGEDAILEEDYKKDKKKSNKWFYILLGVVTIVLCFVVFSMMKR